MSPSLATVSAGQGPVDALRSVVEDMLLLRKVQASSASADPAVQTGGKPPSPPSAGQSVLVKFAWGTAVLAATAIIGIFVVIHGAASRLRGSSRNA